MCYGKVLYRIVSVSLFISPAAIFITLRNVSMHIHQTWFVSNSLFNSFVNSMHHEIYLLHNIMICCKYCTTIIHVLGKPIRIGCMSKQEEHFVCSQHIVFPNSFIHEFSPMHGQNSYSRLILYEHY